MTTESMQPGGTRLADNSPELTEGDLRRAAELQEFQSIIANYAAEAEEPTYSRLTPEAEEPAEISYENPFASTDRTSGAESDHRDTAGRARRIRTSLSQLFSRSETGADDPSTSVRIQDYTSRPFAVSTQLSLDTIWKSPDHYSTFDIAPQPDGGRGMHAMAKAYVERERQRGKTDEPTVVWAYSHNGLDLRDFLHSVSEIDAAVGTRTKAVLACDSPSRLETIKHSGLFKGQDVEFQPVDPQDPGTFALPDNTGVALLPDSLDKLPAHQVLRGANSGQVLELLESTSADLSRPIIRMDRRSGQARTVPADVLRAHETAEDIEERYEILPQLFGRLLKPERASYKLEFTELDTREESTEEFLQDVPTELRSHGGTVFNYSQDVEDIVAAATAGVREDGMVYISGPVRNQEWLHPDNLTRSQGPVVSHVLEASSLRRAAKAADPELPVDTAVTIIGEDGGDYSYVLIDRSPQPEQADTAFSILRQGVAEAEPQSDRAAAHNTLDQAREALREAAREGNAGDEHVARIRQAYEQLVGLEPQAGRDLSLSLGLARDCNDGGFYDEALDYAHRARRNAPYMSAALVETARAQAGQLHPGEAIATLISAYRQSPRNPDIYANMRRIFDQHPNFKAAHLTKYVEIASGYLQFGHDLSNQEIIETLESITSALQEDWEQHQDDTATFKTIYEQDLETGTITERTLSVRDMKRIMVADAAEANAQVAGALLRYQGGKKQAILRAQEKLLAVWHQVVPRGGDRRPLPRDAWVDRNQDRRTRWIHSGSLYQDDAHSQPPDPSRIRSFVSLPVEYELEQRADTGERRARKADRMELSVGYELDELKNPTDQIFLIKKANLSGNMLITGRTGMGKTTFLESSFEQLPDMKTNFWAFDLGDKSELHTVADRLNAKGIPVTVIRPGAPDEDQEDITIPSSVNMFTPVEGCSIDAHIGKFVDAWITAYGGGGDSPVGPILTASLREIYAANGWQVTPIEGEELPEIGHGQPTTPTLQELLEACVKRAAEYGKNTNAGNISVYFKRRIEALEGGAYGNFLFGENGLDWAKLNKTNVIFDFSHITSHDQRRFLFTALTMQASSYLQFQKGLTKETDMVWAIDEASLVTLDAGEEEMSRKQGIEAFAALLKVVRGYGVSVWNSTQSTQGIHPDFLSQNAVTVSLSMRHAEDKHAILTALGLKPGTPEYDKLFHELTSADKGVALIWQNGMSLPIFVKVEQAEEPSEEALARVRRPEPPIKANPYSKFTVAQHGEAIRQSMSPEQAWKQLFIGAVVLAHVAQIDLPSVPAELKQQWEAETKKPEDAEFARLLLYHITKQAVRERVTSIRSSYSPNELTASVMANALGLLYGEANARRVSPAFGLLSIREGREFKRLHKPDYGLRPADQEFAGHFEHELPQPVRGVRKVIKRRGERKKPASAAATASAQVIELKRHHASPANAGPSKAGELNTRKAKVGLIGNTHGSQLWKSIRTVTEGEPSIRTQRRLVAAALGYLASCFSPQESELEEVLSLAIDLHEQESLAA